MAASATVCLGAQIVSPISKVASAYEEDPRLPPSDHLWTSRLRSASCVKTENGRKLKRVASTASHLLRLAGDIVTMGTIGSIVLASAFVT